jgi:hypothetical protein
VNSVPLECRIEATEDPRLERFCNPSTGGATLLVASKTRTLENPDRRLAPAPQQPRYQDLGPDNTMASTISAWRANHRRSKQLGLTVTVHYDHKAA